METVSSMPLEQLHCRRAMPRRRGLDAFVRAHAQQTTLARPFLVHHALQALLRLLEAGFLLTVSAPLFTMFVPMVPARDVCLLQIQR